MLDKASIIGARSVFTSAAWTEVLGVYSHSDTARPSAHSCEEPAIAAWEQNRSIHAYFQAVEQQLEQLMTHEARELRERREKARALVGEPDALAHLLSDEMNGTGGDVLYLDFDGVLHHENCFWHPRRGAYLDAPPGYMLFQHAELLSTLLAPYPQVEIVLSTSWVRRYGCSDTAKRLPRPLRARVIGATFHTRMNERDFVELSRGQQVLGDVMRRQPKRWLALDDDPDGWTLECLPNFLQTDEREGINMNVPENFPRLPDPTALSGAHPKIAARLINGAYVGGYTQTEIETRYEVCADLLLAQMAEALGQKDWGLTAAEIAWCMAE
eukprot:gene12453-12540_t